MYKIPLPLPKLVLENLPDDTGFTLLEKRTLRNAWAVIGLNVREHAIEQSVRFLTENEDMLANFRADNEMINVRVLYEHSFRVFDVLENLISEGLKSQTLMHGIVNRVAGRHFNKKVGPVDIRRMSEDLSAYLKKLLRKVMSPTLEQSIDKICGIIMSAHK